MRIRKRLALCSINTPPPPPPLSDPHLRRSAEVPPPHSPSDQQQMWALLKSEATTKQKEYGDDHEAKNDDIRKIVNICDGGEGFNANMHPSSSITLQESYCNEDYKLFPLKKRKGVFERNPNEEPSKMKSKTNKKCGEILPFDQKPVIGEEIALKKSKRGNVIMEGSRCSRVNGRGWRCCQPTLVGYSLCEHHLGKGRLRSVTSARRQQLNQNEGNSQSLLKKRSKVGVVKARSMSSLLSQI